MTAQDQQSRAEFERLAVFIAEPSLMQRDTEGYYISTRVQGMWIGWLAARALPAAESVAEKIAPVQGYTPGIPWSLHLEAYDAYSKRWSPQPALIDLEGRNCRGGFSTGELDGFVPGWRDRVSETGKLRTEVKELRAMLATDQRTAACAILAGAEPTLYLSTEQVVGLKTLPSAYIPFRLKPEGLFQTAMFTAAQVQAMGRVPPGWQAVPVGLPPEMKREAMDLLMDGIDLYTRGETVVVETAAPDRLWRAMLAAASRPPAAQGDMGIPITAAQERKPLRNSRIDRITFTVGGSNATEHGRSIARAVEAAHGITGGSDGIEPG